MKSRRVQLHEVVGVLPRGDALDCRFIDAEWLSHWANAEHNGNEIDNEELLCPHKQLDPLAWRNAKCVSALGWGLLEAMCGGGPELSPADLCLECTRQQLANIVARCVACFFAPVFDVSFYNSTAST